MKKLISNALLSAALCLAAMGTAAAQEGDQDRDKRDRDRRWEEAGHRIGEAVEEVGSQLERTLTDIFDEDFGREMADVGREVGFAMRELSEEVAGVRDHHSGTHGNFDEERSKKLSKSYKVKASDQLSIENKFGKVHVNTWDKNEITVEVIMIGRANDADRAQRIVDAINVEVNEGGGVIAFRTEIGKMQGNNHNGKKGFEINYTVSMPKGNPLKLKNSFGDVYLGNLDGKADLNVSYGSLKAENLTHAENFVKVAFGSGNVEYLKGGTLDVDYSKVNVERMGNLTVNSGFSKLTVEKAGNVDLKARYGDVQIGTIDNLVGSAGFSGVDVNQVNEKVNMKVEYCNDFDVNSVARNFKEINVDGSFSKISVTFDPATSFNFDVNVQYGDLDANDNLNNFSFVEKKSNSKVYRGNFGKTGGGNVKISSRYGNVDFDLGD
jgi:formylmethanofuran dehydrogenase subunit D